MAECRGATGGSEEWARQGAPARERHRPLPLHRTLLPTDMYPVHRRGR
eukprot:CAMPEP_0203966418 /NCGR_PEP_ID=MMETSP0359-20131031/95664_1 /ASSEMBLY_ACC=CAM_ASM_000338 /TAXON_ID=268821 /ORGANISM="Scrippsiella Hangoei, Strain SHTV-5" /LENGTH=47 /DNA_ID= /DNA_START= /DNA_END= /DNA_ORIENTATION=